MKKLQAKAIKNNKVIKNTKSIKGGRGDHSGLEVLTDVDATLEFS